MTEFGHTISLNLHLDEFEEITLPGEFQDVADDINNEIRMINKAIENQTPNILEELALDSQLFQRESLISYDSIISRKLFDDITISGGSKEKDIGTNLFYAKYVNDGRGPVVAKNKKYLHFITKDGTEIFAKKVGPAEPRPYIEDSSEELAEDIDELVTSIIEAII